MIALGASNVEAALREAYDAGCDLLVVPIRSELPTLRYAHVSDRHLLAGGLWFTTLFGGWFVEDATYETRARLDFAIYATESRLKLDTITAESEFTDLAFRDRNSALSFGALQSPIMPPFWTSDDAGETRNALFERPAAAPRPAPAGSSPRSTTPRRDCAVERRREPVQARLPPRRPDRGGHRREHPGCVDHRQSGRCVLGCRYTVRVFASTDLEATRELRRAVLAEERAAPPTRRLPP